MRDYRDPDDRAHLMADYPTCSSCRRFWPLGTGRKEGRCSATGDTVRGNLHMAGCASYEGRP